MSSKRHVLTVYVVVYTVLGLAIGAFGYVSTQWARTTYVTAASGPTVETLGPIFVGLVVFQSVGVALVVGIALAFVVGIVLGSNLGTAIEKLLVGAVGGALGTALLGALAIAVPLVFAAPTQTFSVLSALEPWLAAVVLSAITGLLGGYVVSGFA